MVIHDMRNPTTSIQFGIEEALKILKQNKGKLLNIKIYIETKILPDINPENTFNFRRNSSKRSITV
jgi:hypothetical protein